MPIETISTSPKKEDFTPLSEHQVQTPATFFGARPVLHHYAPGIRLVARKGEVEENEPLRQLHASASRTLNGDALNGAAGEEVEYEVDIWVTSRHVTLYSQSAGQGVQIDFPTIALHALGSQDGQAAVFLQLDLHDAEQTNDDDDIQTLTLHLVPSKTLQTSSDTTVHEQNEEGTATNGTSGEDAAAKAIFEALSACADLNPDPMEEDEDAENVDLEIPGASGWITAENVHEFTDSNGNWTGPEIQFPESSIGQVRSREEDEAEVDDEDGQGEETKWRRIG